MRDIFATFATIFIDAVCIIKCSNMKKLKPRAVSTIAYLSI